MECKPTGQERYLILVPRTKRRHNRAPSFSSPPLDSPLTVARVPTFASYPSRTRKAQAPDAARKRSKSQSGCATLGQRRVYGSEKSKRLEMEGSQRHSAATAWPESMEAERGRRPELDRKSHGSQSGNP
jgi:hypothetical protein